MMRTLVTAMRFGVLLLCLQGCGSVDLGDHVLWSADHEDGTLDAWRGPEGGSIVNGVVSDEVAHSGRYSLKLETPGLPSRGDVGAGFDFNERREAYFSAWYLVSEAGDRSGSQSILRFWSRDDDCSELGELCVGVDVNLRQLPGGQVVVYLFNHKPETLLVPLPEPPVTIPLGRWFHLEALFRRAVDNSGRFHLWVDGEPVYSFEGWRTSERDNLFWSVSNLGDFERSSEVFVDDAAISLIPVTPSGVLPD